MAQEWDIKPRGNVCSACAKEFNDGQACVSALIFGEGGYRRQDYCDGCWQGAESSVTPFSVWRGAFVKPPADPEPLQKETAETLLRKLIEQGDREKGRVIFILAVMLERKRVFVEREVRAGDAGGVVRVYEHRKSGEMFLVTDPGLDLDRLDDVQQEVIAMLGQPPGAEPAPAEAGAGAGGGAESSAAAPADAPPAPQP